MGKWEIRLCRMKQTVTREYISNMADWLTERLFDWLGYGGMTEWKTDC